MSATVPTAIWQVLKARVETIPLSYAKSWPKQNFTPVAGQPYLRVRHLVNANARPFIGNDDPQLRQGILQIDLMMPIGGEPHEISGQPFDVDVQIAGTIAAHFWSEPTLFGHGVKVVIQREPDVGTSFLEDDRQMTPISVRWECMA